MITLFEKDSHRNILIHDLSSGESVQANQHVIVSGEEAMLLDPGGHKVYPQLMSLLASQFPISKLKHIFLSHQDPDIVAATNGWLMVTDADAHISALWTRFIPHFGVDDYVVKRLKPIPDKGRVIQLGGKPIKFIPAHFLHSSGNFQVYDPSSKILYTGDLGASLGNDYTQVEDFDAHIQFMDGFHKRYIPSTKALKLWVAMARKLQVDIIAPQHGAMFVGKEHVDRFIDWIDGLTVGVDLMGGGFQIPE